MLRPQSMPCSQHASSYFTLDLHSLYGRIKAAPAWQR